MIPFPQFSFLTGDSLLTRRVRVFSCLVDDNDDADDGRGGLIGGNHVLRRRCTVFGVARLSRRCIAA
jgi:hypothetical protein